MRTEAAIGLGSNIGDRLAHLSEAISKTEKIAGVRLLAKSTVYETEPVDVPAEFMGQNFLNAVALFEVNLDVEVWSTAIHAIEADMLRVRGSVRNVPRTIDLDLLYFGNLVINQPHLHLPHPQCTARRFVCQPLCELRPNLILPNEALSIAEILSGLPASPMVVSFVKTW